MSFLYEKSATWRRIVYFTKQSSWYMAAFTGLCFVVPYGLGKAVMWTTNPEQEAAKEKAIRARSSVDSQVMARVNRERLAVLLSETQKKGGDDRYAAALR